MIQPSAIVSKHEDRDGIPVFTGTLRLTHQHLGDYGGHTGEEIVRSKIWEHVYGDLAHELHRLKEDVLFALDADHQRQFFAKKFEALEAMLKNPF